MGDRYLEVEAKCKIDNELEFERVLAALEKLDLKPRRLGGWYQLNHYFESGFLSELYENLKPRLTKSQQLKIKHLISNAIPISIRTRKTENQTDLILKSTLDNTAVTNNPVTENIEIPLLNLNLQELDNIVIEAGFVCTSKWSRTRQTYRMDDVILHYDLNSGYGHFLVFEIIAGREEQTDIFKQKLMDLVSRIGLKVLTQSELKRDVRLLRSALARLLSNRKKFQAYQTLSCLRSNSNPK